MKARAWIATFLRLTALPLVLSFSCMPRIEPGGSIHGEIKKEKEPVKGAEVHLMEIKKIDNAKIPETLMKTQTDTAGRFAFENIPTGNYHLSVGVHFLKAEGPCETEEPGFKLTSFSQWQIDASNDDFMVRPSQHLAFRVAFNCPYKSLHQYVAIHLTEFATLAAQIPESIDPYISGKILFINENGIADSHFQLENDMRATEPTEVGTVVFLKRETESSTVYVDKSGTFAGSETQNRIRGTIIDVGAKKVLYNGTYLDQTKIQARLPSQGKSAMQQLVEFLGGLPRH